MISSENRFPLIGIMLYGRRKTVGGPWCSAMRATAPANGSRDTIIVRPLAWRMVSGVGQDGDMALPEDQVAAPQTRKPLTRLDLLADRGGLHVGVAQHLAAGHAEGELDEARAVDAEGTGAAPQIGRPLERLGYRHVIRVVRADGR